MSHSLKKTLPTILFLLVFSLLFLHEGIPLLIKSLQARSWPKTTGVIVDTDFAKQKRHVKYSSNKLWNPYPVYSYSVNGQEYVGDRIHLNFKRDRVYFESDLDKVKEKYPTGKTVDVYYNPKNPADSILDNTLGYYSGFNSFASLLIMLIPIAIVGFVLREK